jgi:hypothetical protein
VEAGRSWAKAIKRAAESKVYRGSLISTEDQESKTIICKKRQKGRRKGRRKMR